MVELMANYFLCSLEDTWRLNEEKLKQLLKKLPRIKSRTDRVGYHLLAAARGKAMEYYV
jgi:hypothetical protein